MDKAPSVLLVWREEEGAQRDGTEQSRCQSVLDPAPSLEPVDWQCGPGEQPGELILPSLSPIRFIFASRQHGGIIVVIVVVVAVEHTCLRDH